MVLDLKKRIASFYQALTQPATTSSKLTIEKRNQGVKYVQSQH